MQIFAIYVAQPQEMRDTLCVSKTITPFVHWKVMKEKFPNKIKDTYKNAKKQMEEKQTTGLFVYTRLVYSLLVTSDYYATTEFMTGLKMENYGEFDAICEFKRCYEESDRVKKIRLFEKNAIKNEISDPGASDYYATTEFTIGLKMESCGEFDTICEIKEYYNESDRAKEVCSFEKNRKKNEISEMNRLRNELFLETEQNWKNNADKNIYFLEAPTGSGKSNVALNLSLNMAVQNQSKIFYVYPFNNLIEQNLETLHDVFKDSNHLMDKITVVNSLTPMKEENEAELSDSKCKYSKILLDRQFMNYPFVLTTHVSLFDIMFSNEKTKVFSFFQLIDSVIVMDEIQSYNIKIWSEIIRFLHAYSDVLNMRVVIMSATLPNLGKLLDDADIHRLIGDIDRYFKSPTFSKRVMPIYDLIDCEYSEEMLYQHILTQPSDAKILVEFITKKQAYCFYKYVCDKKEPETMVLCIMGDDNIIDRKRTLEIVKKCNEKIILIATQVVEAGVDIDMDIGYKSISKLDSEEQFMGRINRSNCKCGKVYFFKATEPNQIYKEDIRVDQKLTVQEPIMRERLEKKEFGAYYDCVLTILREQTKECNQNNVKNFFQDVVGFCDFEKVSQRMMLIEKNDRKKAVFFNRRIKDLNGNVIDGQVVWNEYRDLIFNTEMEYAEKMVKLSQARAKLQYFVYEIPEKYEVLGDWLGELIYVDNGEDYFKNGKLDFERLERGGRFL